MKTSRNRSFFSFTGNSGSTIYNLNFLTLKFPFPKLDVRVFDIFSIFFPILSFVLMITIKYLKMVFLLKICSVLLLLFFYFLSFNFTFIMLLLFLISADVRL